MHPSHECKNSCCRELGRERAGLPKQIWDRFPGQAGRKQGWGRGVGLRGAVLSLSSYPVTGALELPSVCLREAGPQHPVRTRTQPLPRTGTRAHEPFGAQLWFRLELFRPRAQCPGAARRCRSRNVLQQEHGLCACDVTQGGAFSPKLVGVS